MINMINIITQDYILHPNDIYLTYDILIILIQSKIFKSIFKIDFLRKDIKYNKKLKNITNNILIISLI